jgi:DNA gyrase/topoisomerase IV subunit A
MKDTERERRRRAEKLHILDGLLRVLDEPHRFLDVLLSATDETVAQDALRRQFGLSADQAVAAINLQFRSMSTAARQAIRDQADLNRD